MSKRNRRPRPEGAGDVRRPSANSGDRRPNQGNRPSGEGAAPPERREANAATAPGITVLARESGRDQRGSEPRFATGGVPPLRPSTVRGFATVSRVTFASTDSGVGFGDGILDEPIVPPAERAARASTASETAAEPVAAPVNEEESPVTNPAPADGGAPRKAGRRRRRGGRAAPPAGDRTSSPPPEEEAAAKPSPPSSADAPSAEPVPRKLAAGAKDAEGAPGEAKRSRRGRRRSRTDDRGRKESEPAKEAVPDASSATTANGDAVAGGTLDFDDMNGRSAPHADPAAGPTGDGGSAVASVLTAAAAAVEGDSDLLEIGADFDDHLDAVRDEPAASADQDDDEKAKRGSRAESARSRGRGRSRRASPSRDTEDDDAEVEVEPSAGTATTAEDRVMLINVSEGDECRIAILHESRLEELYIERATSASNVGNIYKGRVTNVEPSIQAAFIDFGLPQHGFLHISDVHPMYFPNSKGEPELVGKKTPRRQRPPIQACLRPGREVLVQVIKEGIGTKGPTLSSYISLPGRFLVMMPQMDQLGVSRKIEDEDLRRRLRDMLGELSLPKGAGFIVRTAGMDRTKRDLQRDLNYLTRLWKKVERRIESEPAPAALYKESDLVIRTVRDVYDSNLRKIVVDNPAVEARVREFLSIASPRSQDIVAGYVDAEPMFHRHGIESEIDKLHSRHVPLPCGGSLVIESTEALVAIDVNSGKFRIPENAEETAYRVNLEAVDEIARQLRLRDLGGLIVLDLIDMSQEKHRRAVERRLADALKKHKERAKLLRISRFGLLEMTRQRQRASFAKGMYRDCSRCGGTGRVKATETVVLDVMRRIRLASHTDGVASIDVSLPPTVATELLNRKRHQLTDLERATGQIIRVHAESEFAVDEVRMSCTDRRGREVPGATVSPPPLPIRPVGRNPLEPAAPRPSVPPPNGQNGAPRTGGNGRRRGRRRR